MEQLKLFNGNWTNDLDEIKLEVLGFFKSLFCEKVNELGPHSLIEEHLKLSSLAVEDAVCPVSKDKV